MTWRELKWTNDQQLALGYLIQSDAHRFQLLFIPLGLLFIREHAPPLACRDNKLIFTVNLSHQHIKTGLLHVLAPFIT